jgi:DNA-binding GntR family transcriptional regulator
MLLENYLPLYIFPGISDKFVGNEPLDAYINEHYKIKANISNRIIKSVNLPTDIAKILNERKNAASIQSTNKIYDKENRLIDYGMSYTICSYYFQALITKKEMSDYFPDSFDR